MSDARPPNSVNFVSLPTRPGSPLRLRVSLGPVPAASATRDDGVAIDALVNKLRTHRPAEILLDLTDGPPDEYQLAAQQRLIETLLTLPCRIWLEMPGTGEAKRELIVDRPIGSIGLILKRALDIIGAAFLLFFLSPLLLLIIIAIKLDTPGPVLFRQPRLGYNNELFELLKFRSMNQGQSDYHGSQLTVRNDPRITRVGRFIRRTSIDELPQLINVLRGDMSLVGPRPYPLRARVGQRLYGEVVQNIGRRHRVRPGLTGLAQVSGYRGDTSTEEQLIKRFNYDLYYIDNWTLWLDIKILLCTPFNGLLKADVF